MRKASFLIIGLLFLSAANQSQALVIKQGTAEVHVQTDTEAGNSGTVYMHIDTEVNGTHEVFDSSKSGKMDVDIKSDNKGTVATASGDLSTQSGEEASPSGVQEKMEQKVGFIKTIVEDIQNFFKNLFHFL